MTDFDYNINVPATNNNPSTDQPEMLINAQSDFGIWNVDHIGFNANNGGTHQFMNLVAQGGYVAPPATTANASVYFSKSGVANNAAQAAFQNANATFPLNLIKAWAFCTTAGADATQKFNVNTVANTSIGTYLVTLASNIVFNATYGVQVTAASNGVNGSYTIGSTLGQFTIVFRTSSGAAVDPVSFNFSVMQL